SFLCRLGKSYHNQPQTLTDFGQLFLKRHSTSTHHQSIPPHKRKTKVRMMMAWPLVNGYIRAILYLYRYQPTLKEYRITFLFFVLQHLNFLCNTAEGLPKPDHF